MKFTPIQESIWEILKTYRCLRDDQIDRLICAKTLDCTPDFVKQQRELMLGLCSHLICKPLAGYTGMTAAALDIDLVTAIDVMLLYQKRGLVEYRPGTEPFNLTFIKSGQDGLLRVYYLAVVHKDSEFIVSQQVRCAYKGRKNVVLFLLDDIAQADAIEIPYEHCHIIREENGFHFYKGVMSDG